MKYKAIIKRPDEDYGHICTISTSLARQYAIREAPEGQTKISDKVCKRCMYHCLFGVSDRIVACMYADKEHHCRTLEPDYVHGYCKYFKKGRRKTGDPYRSTYFRSELPPWTLHEK